MSSQPNQFSLRALLAATGCVAVVFALLPQPNGHVILLPLVTFVLFYAAAFGKRTGFRFVLGTCGVVAGILAVANLELASGFNRRVPFIGKVPCPLSRILEIVLVASLWVAIGFGVRHGLRAMKSGQEFNQLLAGIFLLGLLWPAWFLLSINGHIVVLPATAVVLLIAGALNGNTDLRRLLWSWAAVAGSAALVELELASRYRLNPPSPAIEGLIVITIWLVIALGLWQGVAGARSGRFQWKTACWIAGFALLAGMLYILVLNHNGPAIALATGAFALIAAGVTTRRWLYLNRMKVPSARMEAGG